jgi:uncharacterized protein YqjF (DUF2071 family)/uncharacterized protein with NAD-binding domain and iron-sulfur cluster
VKSIIVLGGGVAGLTAAHELAERGYAVTLFERRSTALGGKARSENVTGATGGRLPLPGEHGFRFFPGFYKHVPDTMSRIPVAAAAGPQTVLTSLVPAPHGLMASVEYAPFEYNMRLPENPTDWKIALGMPGHMKDIGLTLDDMEFFSARLLKVMTYCNARRLVELDTQTWWSYIDAADRSPAFQKFLATGLTRNAVATQANVANARTISDIAIQLMHNMTAPGEIADRVLTGPTTAVWIEPWRARLTTLGVQIHQDATVTSIEFDGRVITGAMVSEGGTSRRVTADYYVCALPLNESAVRLPASLLTYDPTLSGLPALKMQMNWMTGIQFYLDYDPEIVAGHMNFIDSPWAITAISQKQFWPSLDLTQYGDGTTRGILSVDISNWTAPAVGGPVAGKTAMQCSKDEIAAETWRQLQAGLSGGGATCPLTTYASYWLDDSILHTDAPGGVQEANVEPLLVNQEDSWKLRPNAATHVDNLVLAGDYIRTSTDFASMEAANESARRAVNALLPRLGYDGPLGPCQVWNLHEPDLFLPFKAVDMERFARGEQWLRPEDLPRTILEKIEAGVVHMTHDVEEAAEQAAAFVRGLLPWTHDHARALQEKEINGIFERNRHRENPLPSGEWATFQTWQNLLFTHWPVPASVITPYLPKGLEVDLFEGQAYVSMVAMKMGHICFRLIGNLTSTIPGESSFPELNLRTYVTCNGRKGVYFLRADAEALIADLGARLLFHMPYGPATMSLTEDNGTFTFRSHRTVPPVPDATYALTFTPSGELTPVVDGTRTAFLRNRDYAFLGVDGQIKSLGLLHDPWQVQPVTAAVQVNTVLSAAGFNLPDCPMFVDYTPEIKVVLWNGEPVGNAAMEQ